MRTRKKNCFKCGKEYETLFRCAYYNHGWVFLCGDCVQEVKCQFVNSYKYGGTWKKFKS